MALTLRVEQKLNATGLTDLFNKHQADWGEMSKNCYEFVVDNFPEGSKIRRDDVAENLVLLLKINERLKNSLGSKKGMSQQYWFRYFCDLILDRTWDDIVQ